MTFTYDASGNPKTMTWQGNIYYYLTNPQGDVIGITDASGTRLVYYYYTAQGTAYASKNGNTVDLSTTLLQINPLTYRGYVYDRETRCYYLQSRYYNHKVGRFINADGLASTGQGLLGNNMFAYCNNNPANHHDPNGDVLLPILSLADYYIVHKMVQCMVVASEWYAMEVHVLSPLGRGYLDLYDPVTNQYYEVKHYAQLGTWATVNQMEKYNSSHIFSWMFTDHMILESPEPGSRTNISGSFEYFYWDVKYKSHGNGIITYELFLNKRRYFKFLRGVENVATTVALAMGLGIAYKHATGGISVAYYEIQFDA